MPGMCSWRRSSLVLGIVLDRIIVAGAAREVEGVLHEVILVSCRGIDHAQR